MKIRLIFVIAAALVFGGALMAQDDHKIEVTGDYSYFRFNPGLPSYFNSQNLNGGGGDVTYFLTQMIGLKADLQGYGSHTVHQAGCADYGMRARKLVYLYVRSRSKVPHGQA